MTKENNPQIKYNGLFGMQGRPLSRRAVEIFLKLKLSEDRNFREFIPEVFNHPILQIMESRLNRAGGGAMDEVLILVASLEGMNSPAKAVMWAYTLYALWEHHQKPVDLTILSNNFPNGFPTEEQYNESWNRQKRPTDTVDNALDAIHWGSLRKTFAFA